MSVATETGARPDQRVNAKRGAGLAIVNLNGELWVHRDAGNKAETGRSAGNKSIAFETQKVGESHYMNVMGAVPEVLNDALVPKVRPHLHTTDGLRSTPDLYFDQGDKLIAYGLAVVVFDGPKMDFQPHVTEEAAPLGWMRPEELLEEPDIRPLAEHAVGYMVDTGLIGDKLAEFAYPDHPKQLVLPEGFVISDFHEMRELTRDMVPGEEYSVQTYG